MPITATLSYYCVLIGWMVLLNALASAAVSNDSLQESMIKFCGPEGRNSFVDNVTQALRTAEEYSSKYMLSKFSTDAATALDAVSKEINNGRCESIHYDEKIEESERDVSRAQKALDDFVAALAKEEARLNDMPVNIADPGPASLKEAWSRFVPQLLFLQRFAKERVGGSIASFAAQLKQLGATPADATITEKLTNATMEITKQCNAVSRLKEFLQDSFSTAANQLRVTAAVHTEKDEIIYSMLTLIKKANKQHEEEFRRICAVLMPR